MLCAGCSGETLISDKDALLIFHVAHIPVHKPLSSSWGEFSGLKGLAIAFVRWCWERKRRFSGNLCMEMGSIDEHVNIMNWSPGFSSPCKHGNF